MFSRCTSSMPSEGDLTNKVKVGIVFGIITLLLFLAVSVIFFQVSDFREQEIYSSHGGHGGHGCKIFPFEVDPSPIIVYSGSNNFVYPKHGERVLKFAPGQPLDFLCPGQTVISTRFNGNNSLLSGTCINGSTVKIGNVYVDWKDLKCSNSPSSTIRYTGNTCGNNSKEIEVGFEITKNRFLRSLLICFNQELQIPFYTYVKLPASINQRVWDTPRPKKFQQGSGFYNIGTVDNFYLRKKQRTTVNSLLGLPDNSSKYIKDISNYFLSRGHLTANMDNFYATQQNATFYFQNVAPQWQTFNGFNWNQIEIDVRDYAENNSADLQVWTGIYGVATLPHNTTGKPVKLYLFVDASTNRTALPVPEIYWKVVYNPVTKRGIALVGVNNPYNSSTSGVICQDVSQNLTWLHYDRQDRQKGYCYACSLYDFRKVVIGIPNIIDRGLLL